MSQIRATPDGVEHAGRKAKGFVVPLFTAISVGALVVGVVGVLTALGPALRGRAAQ
ncbi:MAG TPA: hypothetical protein VGQ42_16455 [Candidatus Dormibacteraeota bacterium]|nr:hypothetical protein [Candidatus Dormibacteraeota bacterium]